MEFKDKTIETKVGEILIIPKTVSIDLVQKEKKSG